MHEDVVGLGGLHVLELHVVAVPEGFQGIRQLDILQIDILDAAEHLRGFHERVIHLATPCVPESGPGTLAEHAVPDGETLALPEGILAVELTAHGLDVGTLLEGGFARTDLHVFEPQSVADIQRALALEVLVFDNLHIGFVLTTQR